MELNEYQELAIREAFYEKRDVAYNALGISGESGEIADHVKKMFRDDEGKLTEERREVLKKELGDVLWYVASMAESMGFTLDEVAEANIQKIRDRKARGVQHGSGDNR